MLLEWVRSTVEWQKLGPNSATVSALATIFFTALKCVGLVMQNSRIKELKTGKSVSVTLFAYQACLSFSFAVKGMFDHSFVMAITGILGFFFVLVVHTLWVQKGFTRSEKVRVAVLPLLVILMVILPWKNTLMTAILIGMAFPLHLQYMEIWRSKSLGALDIRLIVILFISLIFSTVYGYATMNWPLMIINPAVLIAFAILALRLVEYHERARIPSLSEYLASIRKR